MNFEWNQFGEKVKLLYANFQNVLVKRKKVKTNNVFHCKYFRKMKVSSENLKSRILNTENIRCKTKCSKNLIKFLQIISYDKL